MPWNRDTAQDYADIGPQGHLEVVAPLVEELVRSANRPRALDFGCGPGRLTRVLASVGAREVVAVDENPEMVAAAHASIAGEPSEVSERVRLHEGDENLLPELGDFDVVVCSLVLMMSATRERLTEVCERLRSVIRPGGTLLAVVTHPCFRGRDYATFRYELPPDYDYWSSGQPYRAVLTPDDDREVAITDVHWTVEDYVTALVGGDVTLVSLRELPARRDDDGRPVGPPAYLALELRRSPDGASDR